MRVGLYGGTFDPVHQGHLDPVKRAVERLGLDRVVYLPTGRPPHKPGRRFAPAAARYTMVELALLDEPALRVSDLELDPARPAYTIDTVEHFQQTLAPDTELWLLLGADAFAELPTWRRWREIVERTRLAILARPGCELTPPSLPPEMAALLDSECVRQIDNRPVEITASELRRRLARDEALPPGAIPDLVIQYIRKYALYR